MESMDIDTHMTDPLSVISFLQFLMTLIGKMITIHLNGDCGIEQGCTIDTNFDDVSSHGPIVPGTYKDITIPGHSNAVSSLHLHHPYSEQRYGHFKLMVSMPSVGDWKNNRWNWEFVIDRGCPRTNPIRLWMFRKVGGDWTREDVLVKVIVYYTNDPLDYIAHFRQTCEMYGLVGDLRCFDVQVGISEDIDSPDTYFIVSLTEVTNGSVFQLNL